MSPRHPDIAGLEAALREARGPWLFVTGAGLSVASGIPTFRGPDPDAVWSRDVTELATLEYFLAEPDGSWRWYLSRFSNLAAARPNAGHAALVALERVAPPGTLLVTQNIDGLHRRAGQRALVEVHGSCERVRCSRDGCAHGAPDGTLAREAFDFGAFLAAPSVAAVPRCPACAAPVRPHVLWFDELYSSHASYQWARVVRAAAEAAAVLFVGTSFAVGVTELVREAGLRSGAPMFSIDPSGRAPRGVVPVVAQAELALPALADALGRRSG